MKKLTALTALMGSTATLVCCVLPAIFVTLGFGATFASLVGTFPQLIWLSEHKLFVFAGAGVLLALAGMSQWRARNLSCPTDKNLAEACHTTRSWSRNLFLLSVGLYSLGVLFAFALPYFLQGSV